MRTSPGLFALLFWSSATLAAVPVTQPAPQFGPPTDDISLSLSTWPERPPRQGGQLPLRLIVKNESPAALPAANLTAWILLAKDKENAWYSERIRLDQIKDCPPQFPAGKERELTLDLSTLNALVMKKGLQMQAGYPTPPAGEQPTAAGAMGKLLSESAYKARFTLILPKEISVVSNPMTLVVGPPVISTLPPEKRKALLDDLIAQFNKGAFGGQAAHRRAVLIGPEAVDPITAALAKPGVPPESKMWLTTALIDIGDPRAVETLIKLLDDGAARTVIAYHGPKLNNPKLDRAIEAAAASSNEPAFVAWAARGAAAHGSGFPEKLVALALKSTDPRARAEIAQVLLRDPTGKHLDDLLLLLKDPDMRVRSAVAKAIGASTLKEKKVIAALVGALDSSDDAARSALCAALGALTGQSRPYETSADETTRAGVIAHWKKIAQ